MRYLFVCPLPTQFLALRTLPQRSIPNPHHSAAILLGGLQHCCLVPDSAEGLGKVELQHGYPDFESSWWRYGIGVASTRHLQVVQGKVGLRGVRALRVEFTNLV